MLIIGAEGCGWAHGEKSFKALPPYFSLFLWPELLLSISETLTLHPLLMALECSEHHVQQCDTTRCGDAAALKRVTMVVF